MAISPEHARGKLGATIPAKDVSGVQAFGVELVASFLLVLTMLASIEANKDAARREYGTAAALGVVVTLCYLIAVGTVVYMHYETSIGYCAAERCDWITKSCLTAHTPFSLVGCFLFGKTIH